MKIRTATLFGLGLLSVLAQPWAIGQRSPEQLQAIRARLGQLKALVGELPEKHRKMLSGGIPGLLQTADKFDQDQRPPNLAQSAPAAATAQPEYGIRIARCRRSPPGLESWPRCLFRSGRLHAE